MTEEGKCKWERNLEYGKDSSTLLRKQSMINNEFLSDVVFLVGQEKQRIYAHKLILILSSEYFYVMFFGSFAESKNREVTLDDVDPQVFLMIMRFIYTGKIELTDDNFHDIFESAQKYMLTELKALLGEYKTSDIKAENALRMLNVNRYYGFSSVDEKCLDMISNNPLYYFNHVDLQIIDKTSFAMILSLKQINCSEDQLHMALEIWASCRKEADDVQELLKIIECSKRSYNCLELRFFGQRWVEGTRPVELKFCLVSPKSVSLYGIGVFIASESKVVPVEVTICNGQKTICTESFEVTNKLIGIMHVVNLCFEEIVMLPLQKYSFEITFPTGHGTFVFYDSPEVYHKDIRLEFLGNRKDAIAIAHILCKENPA